MGNRSSKRKSKKSLSNRDLVAQTEDKQDYDSFKHSIDAQPFDGDQDLFYDNGDCNKSVHNCGSFRRIKQNLRCYKSWISKQKRDNKTKKGIYDTLGVDISDMWTIIITSLNVINSMNYMIIWVFNATKTSLIVYRYVETIEIDLTPLIVTVMEFNILWITQIIKK